MSTFAVVGRSGPLGRDLSREAASALAESSGGDLAARCPGCGEIVVLDGDHLPFHGRLVLPLSGGTIRTVRCSSSGRTVA
jgi:hypothetical protein